MDEWQEEYYKQGAKFFAVAKLWLRLLLLPIIFALVIMVIIVGFTLGTIL